MNPLTRSYFCFWACFDAEVGKARASAADCIAALSRCADADPEFLRIIDIMRASRMGLRVCEGSDCPGVTLHELVTGEHSTCIVAAGYRGQRGEVWLARVLAAARTAVPGERSSDHAVRVRRCRRVRLATVS